MNKVLLPSFDVHTILSIKTINYIAYYHYSRDFLFKGEYHDTWELVYVDLGEVVIQAGTQTFLLPQKHFFLHPHNEFHSIRANNCRCKVMVLSFQCEQGDELLFSLCQKINAVPSDCLSFLKNILEEYKNHFDGVNLFLGSSRNAVPNQEIETSLHIVRNYLEVFFLSILRLSTATDKQAADNHTYNEIVSTVISFLSNNLHTHISLDDLADNIGYSQSYLSKNFHRATGTSITSYLINLRVDHAKILLANEALSIQDIATQTGFSSLQYFSKVFKSKTGYSPSEFRKSIEIHQRYDFENY